MAYYVYIMTNKWHTVLYTGVTGPLEQRITQHKNKEIEGFTKRYNVTKLVYVEEFKYVNDAIAAEKRVKGWTKKKKIALIESINPEWKDLFDDRKDSLPKLRDESGRRAARSGDPSPRVRGPQDDRIERMIIHELNPNEPNRELVIDQIRNVDVFVPILSNTSGEYTLRVVLRKEGMAARVFGAGVLTGNQKLKLTVDTIHEAPNTTGSTLVKAVLKDTAQFDFAGMIKILKPAQGSNDFLQQDSLLLSDEAQANAVPSLEIEANEVKASHAATAAPVNQDQLFYLRSRGIPETMAVQLVAEAFLAPAMRNVDGKLRDQVLQALSSSSEAQRSREVVLDSSR